MLAVVLSVFAERQRSLRPALDTMKDPIDSHAVSANGDNDADGPSRIEYVSRRVSCVQSRSIERKLRTISLRNGEKEEKKNGKERSFLRLPTFAAPFALLSPRRLITLPFPVLTCRRIRYNVTLRAQRGIVRKQHPAAWSPGNALIPPRDENRETVRLENTKRLISASIPTKCPHRGRFVPSADPRDGKIFPPRESRVSGTPRHIRAGRWPLARSSTPQKLSEIDKYVETRVNSLMARWRNAVTAWRICKTNSQDSGALHNAITLFACAHDIRVRERKMHVVVNGEVHLGQVRAGPREFEASFRLVRNFTVTYTLANLLAGLKTGRATREFALCKTLRAVLLCFIVF